MAKKILLVDDETIVIKSLSRLLEKEGYQVVSAASAQEALMRFEDIDFSLIISDIRMPGKNGLELIKEAQAHRKNAEKNKIPAILITGYADMACQQKDWRPLVEACLYKPFDSKELIEAVKRALDKS